MTNILDEAPEWFNNILALALQDNSDDAREALLGIGKLLLNNELEAFRLAQQLRIRLEMHASNGVSGENGSTQLHDMLHSGRYPEDLCNRIQSERR